MSIREYIADIFEDNYLMAKVQRLTFVKNIWSDLHFLCEQYLPYVFYDADHAKDLFYDIELDHTIVYGGLTCSTEQR